MNDIQKRLREFLEYKNLSHLKFERECGLGYAASKRISDKSYSTTFKKIKLAFPDLNIGWLKTGNGEMITTVNDELLEELKAVSIRDGINPSYFEGINRLNKKCQESQMKASQLQMENRHLKERLDDAIQLQTAMQATIDSKEAQIKNLDRLLSALEYLNENLQRKLGGIMNPSKSSDSPQA